MAGSNVAVIYLRKAIPLITSSGTIVDAQIIKCRPYPDETSAILPSIKMVDLGANSQDLGISIPETEITAIIYEDVDGAIAAATVVSPVGLQGYVDLT